MNHKKRNTRKSGDANSHPEQRGAPRRAPSTRSRVSEAKKKSALSVLARKKAAKKAVKKSPKRSSTAADASPSKVSKSKRSVGLPKRATASQSTRGRLSGQKITSAEAPSLSAPPKRKKPNSLPKTAKSEPAVTANPAATEVDDPYSIHPQDVSMLGIGSRVFPPNMDFHLDSEAGLEDESGSSLLDDDPDVQMRIRELEERLDGLMASVPHEDLDSESEADDGEAPLGESEEVEAAVTETAADAAREVLESSYYRKNWGRGSLEKQSHEVDEFGRNPEYEERLRPALDFLYKKYFRVELEGIANIPDTGRAVVVANHSGALPFDGVMLREAIRHEHPCRNDLRWLAEDFSFYLPFLGVTLNRIGAVRACPENAERLLSRDHLVGVFPEGVEGIKKLYKNRYQLQRFGRGGFVRLCLRTRSPIIPCAILGAEETNPILYRFDNLSKLLGLDYLPITPTFPLLGPLGLLPAPTKWRIVFGEPISFDEYGPQAALDHVLVGRLAERVRVSINDLLQTALRRRKSIWL